MGIRIVSRAAGRREQIGPGRSVHWRESENENENEITQEREKQTVMGGKGASRQIHR